MLFEHHELLFLPIRTDPNIKYRGRTGNSIANCTWWSTTASMRRLDVGTLTTNGICDRFGAVTQHEFNQMEIRRKLCMSPAALRVKSVKWVTCYKALRTHKQKMCCGCAAMAVLHGRKEIQKRVGSLNLL